jgi:hypothetical protein
MRNSYQAAIEVRFHRLFRDVADGSVDPMTGAAFAVDEINASFGRGMQVGEHTAIEKRPAISRGVNPTSVSVS